MSNGNAFPLQLREHKNEAGYDPNMTFSKPNDSIKCYSNNASIGCGYAFASLPTDYLHGRKLKLTWQTNGGGVPMGFYARIYDGAYNRASDTDFPSGSDFPTKGAGLLQTIEDLTGDNASHTVTVTMDLSSAQLDTVTIMIWVYDGKTANASYFIITALDITDTSDNVLWSADLPGTLDMEVTGTLGDYGILGEYIYLAAQMPILV